MRNLYKPLLMLLALTLTLSVAMASGNPTVVAPATTQTTHADGTIGTGGTTFQTLIPAGYPRGTKRFGCLIQNNGAHTMYVYIGPPGNATQAASYTLIPPGTGIQGGSFGCADGSSIIQDEVSISGTSGESFSASYTTYLP